MRKSGKSRARDMENVREEIREALEDDYENPLQLLARKLAFTDPLTGKEMSFESELRLRF